MCEKLTKNMDDIPLDEVLALAPIPPAYTRWIAEQFLQHNDKLTDRPSK